VPEDEEEDIVEPTPRLPVLRTPPTPLTRKRGKKTKADATPLGSVLKSWTESYL